MQLKTIVLRHRRENLKKCSLRGLETRPDMLFFTYPQATLPDLNQYLMLDLNAPALTRRDAHRGIFLLDGTWRYAQKMAQNIHLPPIRRSLPPDFVTAYPRKQTDCPDPERGLASCEALYLAYHLLGWDASGLLDGYRWSDAFIDLNSALLSSLSLVKSTVL